MELLDLPDDVLLEVFARLPARDVLLRVRVVCRRFQELALHPDVCRHLRVACCDSVRVAAVALRLAPCLRRLELCEDVVYRSKLASLIFDTDCDAAEFTVLPNRWDFMSLMIGYTDYRLDTSFWLRFFASHCGLQGFKRCLKRYVTDDALKTDTVECSRRARSWMMPPVSSPIKLIHSFLREPKYSAEFSDFGSLVQHCIPGHASALETVGLPQYRKAAGLAPLLTSCTSLERATLPSWKKVALLLRSPKVTLLKLFLFDDLEDASNQIAQLLMSLNNSSMVKALVTWVGYAQPSSPGLLIRLPSLEIGVWLV